MQETILRFFQSIATPFLDVFFELISFLGEEYTIIAIVSWMYWNYSKKEGFLLTFIFVVSSFFNFFLKILFHTTRPYLALEGIEGKRQATATGYAFPSGHTQGAASLYLTLGLIFKKRWIYYSAVILSILVAFSRMYLGVHWPVDVFFGLIFGFSIPLIFYKYLHENFDNRKRLFAILRNSLITIYMFFSFLYAYNYFFFSSELVFSDILKLLGVLTGSVLGFILEEKQAPFSNDAKLGIKIVRYLVGIGSTIALLIGLKLLFPVSDLSNYIRYFIVGVWISGIYPILGVKSKLFEPVKD